MDGLELSGGLRYTSRPQILSGDGASTCSRRHCPIPNPLPTLATRQGGPLFIFNRPFQRDFSALTGSASVQYRLSSAISTYAS